MNYYQFFPNDQVYNNWLLFEEHKLEPVVRPITKYGQLICPRCGKFDHDLAYREGFESHYRFRVRGNICFTSDDFYCVDDKTKSLISSHGIKGITMKKAGDSGWHVISTDLRVNADSGVYEPSPAVCRVCRRPSGVKGSFTCLSEIEVPASSGVFFSPKFDRGGCGSRDLFATEDVVHLLKEQGIKGGMFQRLLTPSEYDLLRASIAKGKPRWPAHSKVML